jgi:hypothetical protein
MPRSRVLFTTHVSIQEGAPAIARRRSPDAERERAGSLQAPGRVDDILLH